MGTVGGVATNGYTGGINNGSCNAYPGGGGGGSASAGGNGTLGGVGGAGGNGTANSITGASVTYAAGGGAGTFEGLGEGGIGGSGIGGNGGNSATNGTANTGSGGGGGNTSNNGGAGGSGVVIIRYQYQGESGAGNDITWTKSGNNIYNSNSGSVGIGTTTMGTFKLAVEGTIGARKIIVTQTSPWPDYVFDKNYKLPSLEEIEKFIKLNNHLLGIPSAKEVEKNGVDVGINQALLLKKIEELTLIAIEQDKEVRKLKKQIKIFIEWKKKLTP